VLRCTGATWHEPGSVVEVAARANAFHLVPAPGLDDQTFPARVEGVTYLGDDVELRVRVGSHALIARIDDSEIGTAGLRSTPTTGDTVHLRIAPDQLIEING